MCKTEYNIVLHAANIKDGISVGETQAVEKMFELITHKTTAANLFLYFSLL
jgi:hypothetical protein